MTAPAVTEKLSQANVAWLKEFSVVMQRRYAYPAGHPARLAAEKTALTAIATALEFVPELVVTITKRQFSVAGGSSDPKNPALGELAERLHRQGIAALTIRRGVTIEEFDALLECIVLAKPPTLDDDDVAAGPALGHHVSLEMLTYEALALAEDEEDASGLDIGGERLWKELAELALEGWDGFDDFGSAGGGVAAEAAKGERASGATPVVADGAAREAAPESPATPATAAPRISGQMRASVALRRTLELPAALGAQNIAKMINAKAHDPETAPNVLKALLKLGRHVRKRGRSGSGATAQRLREVIQALEPGALQNMLGAEKDASRKRLLIQQGIDALPVSAVLDWIQAAATSVNGHVSQQLLLMLRKLASQTHRRRDGGPDEGGEAMREAARKLIEDWTLTDATPQPHAALMQKIAMYEKGGADADTGGGAGADRIVQIALETNVGGPDVTAAVEKLIDEKRLSLLFSFLDEAEHASVAEPLITEHLLEPATVRRVLLTEPVEVDGAHRLLERCEMPQADALFDALVITESDTTRQIVLERLRELGDAVSDRLVARFEGTPWPVQRSLLSLAGDLDRVPPGIPLADFLRHEEPPMRVEALRVAAKVPELREGAIHDAIGDADYRVVRVALDVAAAHGLARRTGPRLLQRIEQAEPESELRLKAIPLLARVPFAGARDWLVARLTRKRGVFFFKRTVLVDTTPESLAGVRALAAGWADDPVVKPIIALASRSPDASMAAAAGSHR